MLMNLLHVYNYCIPYNRTLLLETAIANAVVENTKEFDGLYVPPFLKKGTFVFFAIDNTDFAEDTVDGKGTTHGTITAVYQKASALGEPVAHKPTVYQFSLIMYPLNHVANQNLGHTRGNMNLK